MANKQWTFDQAATKAGLQGFFSQQRTDLQAFGSTVNQTFEAFVFASVIEWYKKRCWDISIVNPIDRQTKAPRFRLKFSTRGEPKNFSYAVAQKKNRTVHIRHQLRVATKAHMRNTKGFYANVCLDVAVTRPMDLSYYKTYYALPNSALITFGEAKHMSAFAELVAGFIGLVFEMQPTRLTNVRGKSKRIHHLAPFLFVSGLLWKTAQGVEYTCQRRGFDIDIYSSAKQVSLAFAK
jgi:hypothetical protein